MQSLPTPSAGEHEHEHPQGLHYPVWPALLLPFSRPTLRRQTQLKTPPKEGPSGQVSHHSGLSRGVLLSSNVTLPLWLKHDSHNHLQCCPLHLPVNQTACLVSCYRFSEIFFYCVFDPLKSSCLIAWHFYVRNRWRAKRAVDLIVSYVHFLFLLTVNTTYSILKLFLLKI